MQALVLKRAASGERGGVLSLQTVPIPELKHGHVLVKLHAAALNRRDEWSRQGLYPGLQFNSVLGADGAGEVVKCAEKKDEALLGKLVVINSATGWGPDPAGQALTFNVLGQLPHGGTFAEYISVPADRVHVLPKHLTPTQATRNFASARFAQLLSLL